VWKSGGSGDEIGIRKMRAECTVIMETITWGCWWGPQPVKVFAMAFLNI
jgi:hypothetical protein